MGNTKDRWQVLDVFYLDKFISLTRNSLLFFIFFFFCNKGIYNFSNFGLWNYKKKKYFVESSRVDQFLI